MFVNNALFNELIDLYYESRFGSADLDRLPAHLVLADWLAAHGCPHLAVVFRDPDADHEGWTIDALTRGLEDVEAWASKPGRWPRS